MSLHAESCPCFVPPGHFIACSGHIIGQDGTCGDCGRPCTCSAVYKVQTNWRNGETTIQEYTSLEAAYHAGLHLSCCTGALSLTVTGGDTVHFRYSRGPNLWENLTPEGRAVAGLVAAPSPAATVRIVKTIQSK